MATKETIADLMGSVIARGSCTQMLFDSFSAAEISALLQFGATKQQLNRMFENSPYSLKADIGVTTETEEDEQEEES
jgi:hypothetical protein